MNHAGSKRALSKADLKSLWRGGRGGLTFVEAVCMYVQLAVCLAVLANLLFPELRVSDPLTPSLL